MWSQEERRENRRRQVHTDPGEAAFGGLGTEGQCVIKV